MPDTVNIGSLEVKEDAEYWELSVFCVGMPIRVFLSEVPFQYQPVTGNPGAWLFETAGWAIMLTDVTRINDVASPALMKRIIDSQKAEQDRIRTGRRGSLAARRGGASLDLP